MLDQHSLYMDFRHVLVTREPGIVTSRLLLIVDNIPCAWTCEAMELALVNFLLYISDILSYKTSDLHFTEYIILACACDLLMYVHIVVCT